MLTLELVNDTESQKMIRMIELNARTKTTQQFFSGSALEIGNDLRPLSVFIDVNSETCDQRTRVH